MTTVAGVTATLHPLEVLLVEDSETDVRLVRELLRSARVLVNLHVVEDGVEALAFLRRQGPYAAAPHIDLVLLDLKLPRKGGREVLAELEPTERDQLTIAILSSSEDDRDVVGAFGLTPGAYLTKPLTGDGLLEVLRGAAGLWLAPVRLPTTEATAEVRRG